MDEAAQSLIVHFENLDLPPEAASWLMDVWRMIQMLDDVADGDAIPRSDLDVAGHYAGQPVLHRQFPILAGRLGAAGAEVEGIGRRRAGGAG